MRTLKARDIRRLRLGNHWLSPRPHVTAREVTEHLGALQAQEIWSGLWSLSARSNAPLDVAAVHQACEAGTILRTWPLRNTVHFIPSADAHWMLEGAKAFAFKGVERRREFIGLAEQDAYDACGVLADALDHGEPTSREDCLGLLEDAGVLTERRHGYHLLWFAAQNGVICMGPQRGATQTFVKLDRWATDRNERSPGDARAELAVRYFTSHGPVAAPELKRWSGLTMGETRAAIALAGDRLTEVTTQFGPMLMDTAGAEDLDGAPVDRPEPDRSVLLLSGFDEYLLGYGDRSTIMEPDQLSLVVPGNNGMFRATIIDDGKVIGVWKRKATKTRVDITLEPFSTLTKRQRDGIDRAADEYGDFLGVAPRVINPS